MGTIPITHQTQSDLQGLRWTFDVWTTTDALARPEYGTASIRSVLLPTVNYIRPMSSTSAPPIGQTDGLDDFAGPFLIIWIFAKLSASLLIGEDRDIRL